MSMKQIGPGSKSRSHMAPITNAAIAPAINDKESMELLSTFECPVCFDYALPPIMQCQSGHIVCQSCRVKLSMCPTCRGPLGHTVAHVLSRHASGREALNKSCPISCHLIKVSPHYKGEDIVFLATDINLSGAVDWVMMQSCFGHNFMLVLEKQEKVEGQHMFYAIVQLIGTRKQAENFAYRLELNGARRRLTWEATPRSIHDGVQSAISSSDCLVFDTNIAQLFADHGNLGINVTISTCAHVLKMIFFVVLV